MISKPIEKLVIIKSIFAVAHSGILRRGRQPGEGAGSKEPTYYLAILLPKMKEIGPGVGRVASAPLDPLLI